MAPTAALQAAPMARALLELLPAMGGNALIAHRVLRLMADAGGWVGGWVGVVVLAGQKQALLACAAINLQPMACSACALTTLPCLLQRAAAWPCAARWWRFTPQPQMLSRLRAPLAQSLWPRRRSGWQTGG